MSHMPQFAQPNSGANAHSLGNYLYTATGAEGVDFVVTHNLNLALPYVVAWAPAGMAFIPSVDLPNAPGDRTANTTRVLTNGPLTAGDKFLLLFFSVST